ncbi:MAG: hypothetical protein ACUVRK_08075 [Spirochaetota bacterium]
MIEKQKIIKIAYILCLGIFIGFALGKILVAKTVSGSTAISFFITQPLYTYSAIKNKLFSNNPIQRLTGYCTLYELRIIDKPFLFERYKQEEAIASKRVILQILALLGGRDLLHFLDEVYELSDKTLKMQIVKIVKQQYPEKLDVFAQKHKVDAQWIHTD